MYGQHMNEQIGDERVIPSGWLGQHGGGSGSLGIGRGLLLGGGVVSYGVDAGEVVEAEADGDGDGLGAVVPKRLMFLRLRLGVFLMKLEH